VIIRGGRQEPQFLEESEHSPFALNSAVRLATQLSCLPPGYGSGTISAGFDVIQTSFNTGLKDPNPHVDDPRSAGLGALYQSPTDGLRANI
jgi:hypothetical protein